MRDKKGVKVRKDMKLRQMAVIVAIAAAIWHVPRTKVWYAIPDEYDWYQQQSTVKMRTDKFIRFWFERFLDEGTLVDHKIKRIPKSITEEEALNASVWLKTGYWIQMQGSRPGHIRWVHRWYPSIRRACRKCPELKAIRDKYGLSNKQLLYELRKYDPSLRRRKLYCKYEFDDEMLQRRQTRAKSLLKRANRDSTFLDRCYFIDECTIWLTDEIKKGMMVYCDAHDQGIHSVLHYEKLQEDKPIRVHLIAVVNAVHGCVYLEFTTGTDDIQRKHNLKPNDPMHGPYMVSTAVCYLG